MLEVQKSLAVHWTDLNDYRSLVSGGHYTEGGRGRGRGEGGRENQTNMTGVFTQDDRAFTKDLSVCVCVDESHTTYLPLEAQHLLTGHAPCISNY